ncbi:YhjD/YihY/BrkB family envelope integrity protein [Streptomyces sp. NPDC003038]|uniref:YhjD/YihY/BrkB family envelope integrity protein n=1 Tax=unclassified Streptomyces TaxID=2593676 RepID=UPI00339FD6E3
MSRRPALPVRLFLAAVRKGLGRGGTQLVLRACASPAGSIPNRNGSVIRVTVYAGTSTQIKLALFPTLLVTVSVLGIVGASTTDNLISNVISVLPTESRPVMQSTLQGMAEQHTAAWMLAVFGTIGALGSASSYLGVFRRALHVMHGIEDLRPAWRTAPRLVMTALVLLMLLVSSAPWCSS